MRVASPAFLRRTASMSSYYNRRGSLRPHRGYSSHPLPPPAYAGAEFVSGDSHLGAVHAANDSLRRGGGGARARAPPPQYRPGPQFQPPPYGYGYGQPQQPVPAYGFVPYNYSHQQPPPQGTQYGYGTPNQHGHWHQQPHGGVPLNAGFRPGASQLPPRLAEYHRRWRFAQKQPPHQAEGFKVLSYNILADYLAQEHQDLYETYHRSSWIGTGGRIRLFLRLACGIQIFYVFRRLTNVLTLNKKWQPEDLTAYGRCGLERLLMDVPSFGEHQVGGSKTRAN